jgi:hypothetical protein
VEPKDLYHYEFYDLIEKRTYDFLKPGIIFAHNSPIHLGEGFYVSIQASEYHYCDPVETFDNIKDYSVFEVGLFRRVNNKAHGVFVINELVSLMDYSITHDFIYEEALYSDQPLNGTFFTPNCDVVIATFLPPKTIQSMVDAIKQVVRKINSRTVLFEKFVLKPIISY